MLRCMMTLYAYYNPTIGNHSFLVIVSFEDEATGHARALGNALANEVHQKISEGEGALFKFLLL